MILNADARVIPLVDQSVHCVVTSPPYWGLRDYGVPGQLGLERTPEEYVAALVAVFREVWRVLRDDGTLWLNLGDAYNAYNGNAGPSSGFSAGSAADTQRPKLASGHGLRSKGLKPKDLVGIPWRVAFALQADGWYLRSDVIWSKPNPMPESITDRPTKAHEYLFLLAKRERYYYDSDAIREPHSSIPPGRVNNPDGWKLSPATEREGRPGIMDSRGIASRPPDYFGNINGRNRRTVWEIATQPYPEAHFATFPEALVEPCVLAGSPARGTVLDPFAGSGTVGLVCHRLGRRFIGLELKPDYCAMAYKRTAQMGLV